jgi:alkylglycerol monooxygenase
VGWFVLLLAAAMDVLWHMDSMVWGDAAVSVLAVTAGLWGVNALLQNRITPVMCAFVQFAAMATAAAACGWEDVYNLAKPIALLLLMYLAWSADNLPVKAQTWLVRALGLSWVGDVLLLYPGLFVPGLVAFLVAHLCYFKVLSMDAPLLSSKRAVASCLIAGALMYGVLFFNGLPVEMRLPVALYVMVIALMASQAWGRSAHAKDQATLWTAIGASVFMLSDSVLAIDTFINPLPYAGLWVLTTYYVAQALMVTGLLASLRHQSGLQKKPVSQFNQFRNS